LFFDPNNFDHVEQFLLALDLFPPQNLFKSILFGYYYKLLLFLNPGGQEGM